MSDIAWVAPAHHQRLRHRTIRRLWRAVAAPLRLAWRLDVTIPVHAEIDSIDHAGAFDVLVRHLHHGTTRVELHLPHGTITAPTGVVICQRVTALDDTRHGVEVLILTSVVLGSDWLPADLYGHARVVTDARTRQVNDLDVWPYDLTRQHLVRIPR